MTDQFACKLLVIMFRIAEFMGISLLVAGCATPTEYIRPTKANLQEPITGTALVYLLRSPYDALSVTVYVDGTKVVDLPPERYTAISLAPGTHIFTSISKSKRPEDQLQPIKLSMASESRYFLNLPAPERRTENGLIGTVPIGGIPIPLVGQRTVETGTKRGWVEVQEEDSHWFIFYSKPIAPEPGAL